MANALTSVTQTIPAAPVQTEAAPKPASASQKSAAVPTSPISKDTVQISTAAQTALKESQETRAQTAKEAAGGDRQAQRLLAKETAAKKV
jgi:hypothetical protein